MHSCPHGAEASEGGGQTGAGVWFRDPCLELCPHRQLKGAHVPLYAPPPHSQLGLPLQAWPLPLANIPRSGSISQGPGWSWVSLRGQSWGAPKESRGPSEKSRGHPRAPQQVQGTLIGAPERAGLPRKEQHMDGSGDGWAGVPGSGALTSGPRPHNRLWWGAGGWGKCGLVPSPSRLKPQASRGVPGFTLQFIMTLTSFHFLIA